MGQSLKENGRLPEIRIISTSLQWSLSINYCFRLQYYRGLSVRQGWICSWSRRSSAYQLAVFPRNLSLLGCVRKQKEYAIRSIGILEVNITGFCSFRMYVPRQRFGGSVACTCRVEYWKPGMAQTSRPTWSPGKEDAQNVSKRASSTRKSSTTSSRQRDRQHYQVERCGSLWLRNRPHNSI